MYIVILNMILLGIFTLLDLPLIYQALLLIWILVYILFILCKEDLS